METFSNRKRTYSKNEEELITAAIHLSLDTRMNTSDMAIYLAPLLGRTKKGVEQKIAHVKNELIERNEIPTLTTNIVRRQAPVKQTNSTSHVSTPVKKEGERFVQRPKSSSQIIHAHEPGYHLEPITIEDAGKRLYVTVYNIKPYGAFCRTEDGKTGLLIKGMISTEFVTNVSDFLQVGDEFYVLVTEDTRNKGKVLLNAKIIGNIIPLKDR